MNRKFKINPTSIILSLLLIILLALYFYFFYPLQNNSDYKAPQQQNVQNKISAPAEDVTTPLTITQNFFSAIENNDVQQFSSWINKCGVTVIRNFMSGDGVGRGTDFRGLYRAADFDDQLQVPSVKNETPISPRDMFLFGDPPKFDATNVITVTESSSFDWVTQDVGCPNYPATNDLIANRLGHFISNYNSLPHKDLDIFYWPNKAIMITNIDFDFLTGGVAIFQKQNDQYYLTGLLDIR